MISCYHLTVGHPRRDGALLDDISFDIPEGSWVDITGEPHSGKSVLFSLLSLRGRPAQGTLIVAGRNIGRLARRKLERLRRDIGSCAQSVRLLPDRTVTENLLLPLVARQRTNEAAESVARVLAQLDFEDVRDLEVSALTSSERRVLGIARAMIGEPSLILIDGGLDDLDRVWRKRVRAALRALHRQGHTVVLFGRDVVGPMTGQGIELRLEDGRLEHLEHSLHAPSPETMGRRR